MSLIPLILQGALVGWLAGTAFPGLPIEFWLVLIANSVTTVAYGVVKSIE
jgi:hypothetical protein